MSIADLDFSDIENIETDITPLANQEQVVQPSPQQSEVNNQPTAPQQEDIGEAPFLAQLGRGQMDVAEGVTQFVSSAFDKFNVFEDALDAMEVNTTPSSSFAKSIVSGLIALNPNEIFREEEVSDYNRKVSEELKLYRKHNPDIQIGRIGGSMATPLSLVPSYGGKGFIGKVVSGSLLGAGMSVASPVENVDEFWAEKGEQAAWGAGLGGSLSGAGAIFSNLVGWADELTKPLYNSGRVRDVSKFLKETFTENKGKIVKALDSSMKKGDKRTVGQIISSTVRESDDDFGGKIIRMEKDLAKEADSLKSLYARQSGDRRRFIDSIAGTDDEFNAAINRRTAQGTKDYDDAFKANITIDSQIKKMLNNKFSQKALKDAKDLAKAQGGASPTEVLHLTKLGLDKQIASKGDQALSKAEKAVVGKVKERLVGWLEGRNPAYKVARVNYRDNSIPINKMGVGREIKNKFIGSLDEDRPSVFAAGIRDAHKTLKKVTGEGRLKSLTDILEPEEVSGLNRIVKGLADEKKATTMASGSKSVLKEITGEVTFDLPHILSRPIVVANHLLKGLGRDKTPEYKAIIADLLQNPDKFIRIYAGSSDKIKTQYAVDIIKRLQLISTVPEFSRMVSQTERQSEEVSADSLDFSDL